MAKQGLRQNWKQFSLLVLINGFVGGMVGLERTILPDIATHDFGVAAKTAILSFIVVFGITKALANYMAGTWADRVGRKNLLVIGWLFALPVPFMLMWAPSWGWIVASNLLLGVNQGLAWSSTVVMKIDLVGEKNRGLAMGLNESAGYVAVALLAFVTGWIATEYGLRPYPFYVGIAMAVLGLVMSWIWVEDTHHHVKAEAADSDDEVSGRLFWDTTLLDRNLGSITQAGLINNLNDGMVWGLLPVLLTERGFGLDDVGIIAGIYPMIWGLGQLGTGKLGDHISKKKLLFWGMLLQAVMLYGYFVGETYLLLLFSSIGLGVGTAIVYPNFLAAVADYAHPSQRAESIGIFRLWRDLGYAIGAILTGIIADTWSVSLAVFTIAVLTVISALIIQVRMDSE
ncbi:MAG: MFS transporter [Bacteroidota bacterium]